jgi:haloacetate dehalogenase
MVERLLPPGASIEPEVMAEYIRCFSDPATIAATSSTCTAQRRDAVPR